MLQLSCKGAVGDVSFASRVLLVLLVLLCRNFSALMKPPLSLTYSSLSSSEITSDDPMLCKRR